MAKVLLAINFMKKKCDCQDWSSILERDYDVISFSDAHKKFIISWLILNKENKKYTINRYGMVIHYCPFCGNKLYEDME